MTAVRGRFALGDVGVGVGDREANELGDTEHDRGFDRGL